ncbi:MAG: hypothetical protein AAB840_00640 [Patescibacteria group bacterium]
MKFNFKISKLDNFYFFISNLTEFHFSCRPHFNKDWIEATGELSQEEKLAILELKPIFKKYGFVFKDDKSLYLGKYFYCPEDKDKWNTLKEYVSESEYKKLSDGFKVFENRLNKLYREDLIQNWKATLEKELSSEKFITLLDFAKHFFSAKISDDILNVHLLVSPSLTWSASGGANLGDDDITLEVPIFNITQEQIELAVCILVHEASHIWFEKNQNYKITEKLSGKNFDLIKEVIINSVAPSGFPAQKYAKASNPFKRFLFHNLADGYKAYENLVSGKKSDIKKLTSYLSWNLYPLAAYYYIYNKKIDKNFITTLINATKRRTTK